MARNGEVEMKKPKRTDVERTVVSGRTDRAVRRAARATRDAARAMTAAPATPEPVEREKVAYELVCKLTAVVGQTGRTTLARVPFNEFGRAEFTLHNWPAAVDFEWELWWGSFCISADSVEEQHIRTDDGTLYLRLQLGDG